MTEQDERAQSRRRSGRQPSPGAGTTGSPPPQTCLALMRRRSERLGTLLCVGLDPELAHLPPSVRGGQTGVLALDSGSRESQDESALLTFNQAIIDATVDLVCAFKPNIAFYEAAGPAGLRALMRTITYIHASHPGVPVILDVKRGDIGSTSAAYARACFETYGADAVTLQPYLGAEALRPFLDRSDKGLFILCRTSNPGGGELQDVCVRPAGKTSARAEPLYLHVARQVATTWNTRANCGLVVGATYPQELRAVREVAGDLPFLVPGIGAQGGDLEAVLRNGLDANKAGLVITSSRSIIYASSGLDFAMAARRQAQQLRNEIERLRKA